MTPQRVEVRWFAALADCCGCREEVVEIAPDRDVLALWLLLVDRHPALGRLRSRPLAVCDRRWASWDTKLEGVREVAFLPPVSGG